jgi:hypothetical protein
VVARLQGIISPFVFVDFLERRYLLGWVLLRNLFDQRELGCGGCQGGITEISVGGQMYQRLDKIAVQGLKGQWTEAAIPFQVMVC